MQMVAIHLFCDYYIKQENNILLVCVSANKTVYMFYFQYLRQMSFLLLKATLYSSAYSPRQHFSLVSFFPLFALKHLFLQTLGCTASASFSSNGSIWASNEMWVEGRGREGEREKEVCKMTGVPPQCQHCNRDRLSWEGNVPCLSE